jgi:hypothetical protein
MTGVFVYLGALLIGLAVVMVILNRVVSNEREAERRHRKDRRS